MINKIILYLTSLCFPVFLAAQSPNIDSLMKHVRYFSSPELSGRLPGDPGFDLAAQYSTQYFDAYGLKNWIPSKKKYKQFFEIDANSIKSAKVVLDIDKQSVKLKPGSDFSVRGYSGSGFVHSEIVFCGYGESLPSYDDYQGVDVKDKIVLIFKANAPFLENHSSFSIREKVDIAYRKGAKAVIFVSTPNQKNPQLPIGSIMHGSGPMHTDVPQIQISVDWADKILASTKFRLIDLQKQIDSLKKPVSILTETKAQVNINAEYRPKVNTYNVIGVLPGSDPKLKEECIIISAHLDHVGYIGNDVYYPGANDDASGSAAVIELARVFSNVPAEQRKRTLVFVLFSCEEKGLTGSEFLANNLPIPQQNITAMLNMDCIAFGDSIQVGNGLTCPSLWNFASNTSQQKGLKMVNRTWKGGGADLTPFSAKGIPGLYFVTTNSYKFLHLPDDTPESLNQDLYAQVCKLVFFIANELVRNPQYKREQAIP